MKNIKRIFVLIILFICFITANVSAKIDVHSVLFQQENTFFLTADYIRFADDIELDNICQEERVRNTFKFLGRILFVVKVVIPIILIVFGAIDFGKALASSSADALSKSTKMFIIRIVSGVVIFLLPTIINFVFSLAGADKSDYAVCRNCLFNPRTCGYNPSNDRPIKGDGHDNGNEAIK